MESTKTGGSLNQATESRSKTFKRTKEREGEEGQALFVT